MDDEGKEDRAEPENPAVALMHLCCAPREAP